jgi:hypothetical protein
MIKGPFGERRVAAQRLRLEVVANVPEPSASALGAATVGTLSDVALAARRSHRRSRPPESVARR